MDIGRRVVTPCFEIVTFHPARGASAEDVRAGFAPSQSFLRDCDGFLERHLLPPAEPGQPWTDLVKWESAEQAHRAAAAFHDHPAVTAIMAVVDPATIRMEHRTACDLD